MAKYFTIKKEGEGLVREKMSRFLSFAMHVVTAEEALAKIKQYQNKFHDSRHVCWAYMLGADGATWQLNDNGEPSGTAGKPILGQIRSKGLTNVLVVVVRYFGGIKLGTSGLIVAYREAARMALDDAEVIECHETESIEAEFTYEEMDKIMRIIKSEELEITDKKFDNICRVALLVKKADRERLEGLLEKAGGKIKREE